MTIVLMVRHGQNDYIGKRLAGRLPGVHLNNEGQRQAQTLAQALKELPITAIYSSPLERAIETAQPLSEAKSLPVLINQALLEVDFGEWTGMTQQEMESQPLWHTVQKNPSEMRFPGGESFYEAQERLRTGLNEIIMRYDTNEIIACFSHSDAIKLAITSALSISINTFQNLIINPASVSILNLTTKRNDLVCTNWQPSLASSLPPEILPASP